MSVVVEHQHGRPPRRQAPAQAGARPASAPRATSVPASPVPTRRPGSPGQRGHSRERLPRDGRRYVSACSLRPATPRLPAMVALAVVLAAGIAGLGLLAGGVAAWVPETAPVPDRTAVVVVERGQSLWELADEYAPESAPEAVVDRIRGLNELTGSALDAGMPLVVPVTMESASAAG